MNIDNGTELVEGQEVLVKFMARVIEVGTNYVEVENEDGDEFTFSAAGGAFFEIQ